MFILKILFLKDPVKLQKRSGQLSTHALICIDRRKASELTNQLWCSIACIYYIDNNSRHHSGQNVLDSDAQPSDSITNTF